MHPRHAPGPGYPSGCRWPACGITCAAPAVRRVACHRACEAAHAALRHSPLLAAKERRVCPPRLTTGPGRGWDPIGAGAGNWSGDWGTHRVVPLGGWPAPPKSKCSSGPLFGPTKQAQGTTDGRRIWGTRGDAASDGAVEGRYGRYAEGGGCAGHAAIAISRCGAAAARRPVRRGLPAP